MENKNNDKEVSALSQNEIPVVYDDGSPDVIERISAPVNSNMELWQAIADKVPVADIIDSNPEEKQEFIREHLTIINNVCQTIYNVAIKPLQKLSKYPFTYNTIELKLKFVEESIRDEGIREVAKMILSRNQEFPEQIWKMAKPDIEIFYQPKSE